MSKVLTVAKHEFMTTLRRRGYQIIAIGIPLLGTLIVAAISLVGSMRSDESTSPAPIEQGLDQEGFIDYSGFLQAFPPDLPAGVLRPFTSRDEADRSLESGEIRGYYVIPETYLASGQITYVHPDLNAFESDGQQWIMRWTMTYNLLGGDLEDALRIFQPMNLAVRRLEVSTAPDRYSEEDCTHPGPGCRSSPLVRMLPMLMLVGFFVSLSTNSGLLLRSFASEKVNHTMEILMLSIQPRRLLMGKLLGLGLAGLLQNVLWVTAIWLIVRIGAGPMSLPAGFRLPASLIVGWVVFFTLGYGLYAALMAGIGALVPDLKSGSQISVIVMIPLLIGYILSIMPFSMDDPHGVIVTIASILPFISPAPMIMRMTVGGVPFWQVLLSSGFMLLAMLFTLQAVGRAIRVQMILSGQQLTPMRYIKALFGAD